jgi:hypothetical protein
VTVPAQRRPPLRTWLPWGISLAVVTLLATLGGFGVGFGVMSACTDTHSCTSAGCPPCGTAAAWSTVGWAAQGVLLLIALTLVVLGARGTWIRFVRPAAWLLVPVSIALMAFTTLMAVRSY